MFSSSLETTGKCFSYLFSNRRFSPDFGLRTLTVKRQRDLFFSTKSLCSAFLMLCLLSTSTPAAPQTIIALANQANTSFAFWYKSGGLDKLFQSQHGPSPRAAEKQTDRDAKVARLEIYPGNVTIDLSERVQFVAVPYDVDGNPVGGVKVKWSAQASAGGRRIRISPHGELQPIAPGAFTITAQASGKSAQATVTVRPGVKPNLNAAPTGSREVSSRDVPAVRIGSNRGSNKSRSVSSKNAQSVAVNVNVARRAHGSKAIVEPMPQGGGGGWDSSNYWSADDPENRVGDPPGETANGAGSGNFQFGVPVYSSAGRGLNISLALSYNSRVWNKAGSQMSFDNDRGWPGPGFNLGFGKLLGIGVYTGCMIVDADGTRHSYDGNITIYNWGTYGVMHTTDGSFIDYTYWTGTNGVMLWAQAKLANGTIITYGAYSQSGGGLFPTSIEDANGNYIYITYLNNAGPRIQTVTDTLGRVLNFYYDYNNLLTAITGPGWDGTTRSLVRLHYRQLSLNYGFASPAIQSILVRDPNPWVIDAIYYPGTGTGYWLDLDSGCYSSYGMLAKVISQRAMGFSPTTPLNEMGLISPGTLTRMEEYGYPMTPNYSLTDAPTYGSMTETWSRGGANNEYGTDSATTLYAVDEEGSSRTITITLPNGTKSKQYSYNAPGSYLDGLVFEDRTFTTNEDAPLQKSTSEWEQGAYGTPRPTRIEKFDERNQKTAAMFSYGSVYNQVIEVQDYDYGGTALLRSTRTTYQNSTNYTGTCYSSGCFGRHIFNLPLSVEIYAADDTRVSRTEYQYDGQPLAATPSVVMHDQAFNPHADEEGFCSWEIDWNDPDCTGQCWENWVCDGYCPEYWVCPYDGSTDYRGNVTQITTYADAANLTGAIAETRRYDVTGNLVNASTSCCEQTTLTFNLDYQYAYPVANTRGSATDWHTKLTTTASYDFNTGLTQYTFDANGRRSETVYDPATLRVSRSILPTDAHTDYAYDDGQMMLTTTTYLEQHPTHSTIADQRIKLLNGRGQMWREKARAPDEGGVEKWDCVDSTFDAMAELTKQTRPYRAGTAPPNPTLTFYDALGRTIRVVSPDYTQPDGSDGSAIQTFYNEPSRPDVASNAMGETTRVQDAWGRERWARTDASGRLVEVVEPVFWGNGSASAGMQTTYSYDTLGNLISINSMSGGQAEQTRTFRYDSLGRLTAQKLAEMNGTLNNAGVYVGVGWSDVFTLRQPIEPDLANRRAWSENRLCV
jgi:YD repeat-containing protein